MACSCPPRTRKDLCATCRTGEACFKCKHCTTCDLDWFPATLGALQHGVQQPHVIFTFAAHAINRPKLQQEFECTLDTTLYQPAKTKDAKEGSWLLVEDVPAETAEAIIARWEWIHDIDCCLHAEHTALAAATA
jgi:hypothetical protein